MSAHSRKRNLAPRQLTVRRFAVLTVPVMAVTLISFSGCRPEDESSALRRALSGVQFQAVALQDVPESYAGVWRGGAKPAELALENGKLRCLVEAGQDETKDSYGGVRLPTAAAAIVRLSLSFDSVEEIDCVYVDVDDSQFRQIRRWRAWGASLVKQAGPSHEFFFDIAEGLCSKGFSVEERPLPAPEGAAVDHVQLFIRLKAGAQRAAFTVTELGLAK